jgi:hypothetical protein
MYKILIFSTFGLAALGFSFCFSACNSAPKDNTNSTANKESSTDTTPKVVAPISNELDDELYLDLDKPATYTGVFTDAVVYAGKTDFDFLIDGKTKLIPITFEVYSQIEKGKKVAGYDLPKDLIDPSKDLEGVPGGNPKLIGKKYTISIAKDLISIKAL